MNRERDLGKNKCVGRKECKKGSRKEENIPNGANGGGSGGGGGVMLDPSHDEGKERKGVM